MTIQVKGVAETLRDLNKINPSLRKELNKDIRSILKPMLAEINQSIPAEAPLSGMAHSGRTGWPNRKNALIKIDSRKPRRGLNSIGTKVPVNIVRIVTKGAPVAIADMAGKSGGNKSRRELKYQRPNFGRALPGDPSRYMWKNAEKSIGNVERQMEKTIKTVVFRANQDLSKVRL